DSVFAVKGVKVGGGHLAVIAGPCAIESDSLLFEVAARVRRAGANSLRGGALKPRRSPYRFQGMGQDRHKTLRAGGENFGVQARAGGRPGGWRPQRPSLRSQCGLSRRGGSASARRARLHSDCSDRQGLARKWPSSSSARGEKPPPSPSNDAFGLPPKRLIPGR